MGIMKFILPSELDEGTLNELKRASVAGGQDCMPFPTQVAIDSDTLTVFRNEDESGYLVIPWQVDGIGRLMFTSATLMERVEPYHLHLELARGKVNQLRSQASDWLMGGLEMPEELEQQIRQATLQFGKAVVNAATDEGLGHANDALVMGCKASDELVRAYSNQVFRIRHERQPQLDTGLGCQVLSIPDEATTEQLKATCNTVWLPFLWNRIEAAEADYQWDEQDKIVNWAIEQGFSVVGGPLLDFYGVNWPSWLWRQERDLASLASFFCDYVETAVHRYRD